jgi:hypothetical protein
MVERVKGRPNARGAEQTARWSRRKMKRHCIFMVIAHAFELLNFENHGTIRQ